MDRAITQTESGNGGEPHLAIVAVHPARMGGMEKTCRFLVDTVLSAGWRVTVALSGENVYTGLAHSADGLLNVERVDWLDRTFAGDRAYRWPTINDRRRWFRRVRPDVALFVQSSNTPMRASVLGAALAGVPIVTTHRTMAWPVEKTPVGRYLFGLVHGLGLHRWQVVLKTWLTAALARYVVYNSHEVRCGYEGQYHYPRRKGRVIVNAVDGSMANGHGGDPTHDSPTAPRIQSGDRGAVTMGYIGRLGREKRLDILIRALAALRTPRRVTLAVYGDGPERDAWVSLANELRVSDQIEWCGPTDDVGSAYRRCDLVVLCSPRESSSNMVIEAMAAGKPVVVTRVGGLPELVGDGQFGVCVPPLDVEALTAALTDLIENDEARIEMGHKARDAVLARHDPAAVRSAWLELLGQAATRKRRAHPKTLKSDRLEVRLRRDSTRRAGPTRVLECTLSPQITRS